MKTLTTILIAIVVVIVGLSLYLAPDNIAGCEPVPGDDAPCAAADAIVAISGGDTLARASEAIELYKRGWAPLLIFSGAAQDKSGPSNAEVMRRVAVESGVPARAIVVESEGETTKQNAEKSRSIFEERRIRSVIVVTSAYHQRRAGLEFDKRSGSEVQVRNHPVAHDKQWSIWWWTTPTGWYLAATEFFKVMAFYVGGTR